MPNSTHHSQWQRSAVAALLLALCGLMFDQAVLAEPLKGHDKLLDKKAYHGEIEEVIVVGKRPKWREPPKPEWRPSSFELQQPEPPRIKWFPKYTKDERDYYEGIHDRMDEKPEIKLFEWKF